MGMTGDQLRTAIKATPFQPFRLHLVDQRKVDVPHPEFAFLFPGGRHLIVATPGSDLLYESIDVALIVSLTPIDDAPAGTRAA
jgi:hypothetical protein